MQNQVAQFHVHLDVGAVGEIQLGEVYRHGADPPEGNGIVDLGVRRRCFHPVDLDIPVVLELV